MTIDVNPLSDTEESSGFEGINRLSRDLTNSSLLLSAKQARYLVDLYYQAQNYRIRAKAQARALDENGEPNALVEWFFDNFVLLEKDVQRALRKYALSKPVGVWAMSTVGIGPVIAAGLLAHIDPEKCKPSAGHIWSYFGLNPTVVWEKGQKRPWNAACKRLTYIIGESFVKVQNNPRDVYGKLYAERKALEQQRNEAGAFADQAAAILASKKFGQDTEAYKAYVQGKLPPAHIHARARRYAVKLFLAHYHHVMHCVEFGEPPPMPYIFNRPEHTHYIKPPNWEE